MGHGLVGRAFTYTPGSLPASCLDHHEMAGIPGRYPGTSPPMGRVRFTLDSVDPRCRLTVLWVTNDTTEDGGREAVSYSPPR